MARHCTVPGASLLLSDAVAFTLATGRIVVIYRPIPQWGTPLYEALGIRWIGFHFFFSFEFSYLRAPKKPRLAGASKVGTELPQKPLAVRTVIVQNGPAWF